MSLKKIQRENQSESIEIFTNNVRKKWDFIIYSIPQRIIRRQKMKIKKMNNYKTTKKKWELKMKEKVWKVQNSVNKRMLVDTSKC